MLVRITPKKRVRTFSRKYFDVASIQPKASSTFDSESSHDMSNFGHLLLCPLCQELFTHPVLLPCQHSLCYGCARSQILSNDCYENAEKVEITPSCLAGSGFNSPNVVSSARIPAPISSRAAHLLQSPHLDTTFSSDSGSRADENESSFVIATSDGIHFEGRELATPSETLKIFSPQVVSSGGPTRSASSALRRSNSTSSVLRPSSAKCRPQQIYGTLKRIKVKSLYCPICQTMVELGKLGIAGLFRNFVLESIVEKFRTKAKEAAAIRCGYCKPPANDATRSCLDCKLSYCNECYKLVHVWGTKKARHHFIGPTNNFTRPKVLLCPEHSNEVNLYCNKCKKSVCRLCKMGGGAHKNHAIISAKAACKEAKGRLCTDLEELRRKKEEVESKIEFLGDAFSELERQDAATRERIHSAIDNLYRLLETKRSELLTKAENKFRENERYLRQELQCHHQSMIAASVANFAEEVLKEPDPAFFLQASRMVELKLKEALIGLTELLDMKIIVPSNDFRVDTKGVEEEMQNIDLTSTTHPSTAYFADDESFCWLLLHHHPGVTIDVGGKTARVHTANSEPCLLKGGLAFLGGRHSWQVSITSYGAKQILVGVGNLTVDEKFHGNIASEKNCAFLSILPGSVSLFEENLPLASSNSSEEQNLTSRSGISIGKYILIVRICLSIEQNDAIVDFQEVQAEKAIRTLFQKSFRHLSPIHPLVVIDGEAIIQLGS